MLECTYILVKEKFLRINLPLEDYRLSFCVCVFVWRERKRSYIILFTPYCQNFSELASLTDYYFFKIRIKPESFSCECYLDIDKSGFFYIISFIHSLVCKLKHIISYASFSNIFILYIIFSNICILYAFFSFH